jgi:hypothetical protein
MEFEPFDFGTKLSEYEVNRLRMKHGSKMTKEVVPESADILILEKRIQEKVERDELQKKQKLCSFEELPNHPNSSINNDSKMIVDLENNNATEPLTGRILSENTKIGFASPSKSFVDKEKMQSISASQQSVTVTIDGKKRIRPVLVQTKSTNNNSTALGKSLSALKSVNTPIKKGKMEVLSPTDNQFNDVKYVLPLIMAKENHCNLQIPKIRNSFSVSFKDKLTSRLDVLDAKNNANGYKTLI